MRKGCPLLFPFVLLLAIGCNGVKPLRPASWLERFHPVQTPGGPDFVRMDVAVLECPLGDHYLNEELWKQGVDEQTISVEQRAVLEDNGFRVGQVGGITPAGLQAMLTSERTCTNPRRIHLHVDSATTLNVGPPSLRTEVQLQQDGRVIPLTFERSRCSLVVVPSLASDGRTRLQFTPRIQHGDAELTPGPSADRSRWELREQRPAEKFASLTWEATLAANEYILIGGRCDRPKSVGHQFFIRPEEGKPVQRLLVIRTARSARDDENAEETSPSASPPLAIQAAWSTVRGKGR